MVGVDITIRRGCRTRIETARGFVRWDLWLESEAERLRAGRFWKQCFIYDMEPGEIWLMGVPRSGEPTRICYEYGWAYALQEFRVA